MGLLRILYRDESLVAVDKPDGLLVHRTRISGDHVFALQLLRDQIGRTVYPVHRLDRPVSGVLVFALQPQTAAKLCGEFAAHRVRKTYLAVVRGFADEQGLIEYPLADEAGRPPQPAATAYRRLATAEVAEPVGPNPTARYSLVEIEPATGRMHQIRRHLRHASHPVIGDTQHGDGRHNRFFRERFGVFRLLLHARRIALAHPADGRMLAIESPVPEEMTAALRSLGWTGVAV